MSSKQAAHNAIFGKPRRSYTVNLQNYSIRKSIGANGQKSPKQLERLTKGLANSHRIAILFLIAEEEGIILEHILERLHGNQKTFSEYTRKLQHAGLIVKKYKSTSVQHFLTPYGEKCVNFLKSF